MATRQEAEDQILNGITDLAKEVAESDPVSASQIAAAIADLAEAWAWLFSPSQPHGGSSGKRD